MKKRLLTGLSALALAALLAACGPEAPAPSETTPPPEEAPAEPVQNSDELLALLERLADLMEQSNAGGGAAREGEDSPCGN